MVHSDCRGEQPLALKMGSEQTSGRASHCALTTAVWGHPNLPLAGWKC